MKFEDFVASISEGDVVTADGRDYTCLQVNKGMVLLRPHGSTIYHGDLTASVRVICLTQNNFDSFYSNHG
ncbi:MAG: hypothetical protein HC771_22310 [Synechococcales cyanobacterium CRU_2_2]|nr:hypothetical protein [Synechococcales cyanobacterium CRU_2_2]